MKNIIINLFAIFILTGCVSTTSPLFITEDITYSKTSYDCEEYGGYTSHMDFNVDAVKGKGNMKTVSFADLEHKSVIFSKPQYCLHVYGH